MDRKCKVFLCHSSQDKDFVHEVARRLQQAKVGIWIDEVEIQIGESLIEKIGEGVHESDLVLAFISGFSVESSWVQKELSLAMTREIRSKRVTVLPLLVEQCQLPYFLRDKLYADFRSPESFETEFGKLIRAIYHYVAALAENASKIADAKSASMSHGSKDVGETDIGSIVHDRGEEFLGYRNARSLRRWGFAFWAQGIVFGFVGALFTPLSGTMAFAFVFFGAFIVAGASMRLIAAGLFRSAFDEDKRILLEVEAIGDYTLPFDKKWWLQYQAGKPNRKYKYGMMYVAGSHFVFLVSILSLIITFLTVI